MLPAHGSRNIPKFSGVIGSTDRFFIVIREVIHGFTFHRQVDEKSRLNWPVREQADLFGANIGWPGFAAVID